MNMITDQKVGGSSPSERADLLKLFLCRNQFVYGFSIKVF